MDISKLAKKPELIKLTISEQDIIERFGEPITFYIKDQFGITDYFNFYKLQKQENDELLNELLRRIILKEDGSPAINDGETLPVSVTLAILMNISDFLGKSDTKATSTQETGTQPN